jgi:hypothetical protein
VTVFLQICDSGGAYVHSKVGSDTRIAITGLAPMISLV